MDKVKWGVSLNMKIQLSKSMFNFQKNFKSGLIEWLPDWQNNLILRILYKNVLLRGLQIYLFRIFFNNIWKEKLCSFKK
jgi:hypothetical protein